MYTYIPLHACKYKATIKGSVASHGQQRDKNGRSVGGLGERKDHTLGSVCSTRRNIYIYINIYTTGIQRKRKRENVDTNKWWGKTVYIYIYAKTRGEKMATYIYVYVAFKRHAKRYVYSVKRGGNSGT